MDLNNFGSCEERDAGGMVRFKNQQKIENES